MKGKGDRTVVDKVCGRRKAEVGMIELELVDLRPVFKFRFRVSEC